MRWAPACRGSRLDSRILFALVLGLIVAPIGCDSSDDVTLAESSVPAFDGSCDFRLSGQADERDANAELSCENASAERVVINLPFREVEYVGTGIGVQETGKSFLRCRTRGPTRSQIRCEGIIASGDPISVPLRLDRPTCGTRLRVTFEVNDDRCGTIGECFLGVVLETTPALRVDACG